MDPRKCVACRNCEYACAFKKTGDFARQDARIRVNFYAEERISIPLACVHCQDPFCLEVCPAGAIKKNASTGAIEIDELHCVGCKMCMLACPFGAVIFDSKAGVSRKCDLCQGEPNCVKFCISGALQYVSEDIAYDQRRKQFDARLKNTIAWERTGSRGRLHE
jgi:carbon-monoxide dehydrogenase iron sulfur subunit